LFSQKKYVRKIDWAHVKVLTNFACQLLFLVVGTKTYKLWSKFEEQDHETRLWHTNKPTAGLGAHRAGSTGY
jgi:hypothetical protein